jgi:hypothetical protein
MDLWYRTIREVRPLVSPDQPLRSARELVFLLGPAVVALPAAAWLARDGRRAAGERAAWAVVGIVLAAYTVLAVWQARFAMFAELAAIPAYAAVCLRVLGRWGGGGARAVVAVRRAAIVVLFATGWLLAGAALYRLEGPPVARATCPVTAMARHLGTDPALSLRPRRYMAFLFDGPEILYRSPHSVVGAPYQRNVAGIYATHAFFTDATPGAAEAHRLARRLELDHVLVCRHGGEARHYLAAGAGGGRDGPTLFGRLRDDAPPDWLRAVALPETLSGDFALYTVVR